MDAAFPPLAGVTHRFVDLPGLRMHVAEAGQGEPILLLHGFPQHWWEWRKVIPELAERYHVICPDLRGAGLTDAPRDGYRRSRLLADALALLDALGLDRVHVISHDWGSILGFQLSLSHPGRVRSHLALAVPHPYIRFQPKLLRDMWRLWFQLVLVTPWLGSWLLRTGRQRFARYLLLNFAYDKDAWTDGDLELFLAPLRQPDRARAGGALYRGYIMREGMRIMTGKYRGTRLSTPTRILVGAQDPGIRPDLLDGYQDHTDDLAIETVSGAAHFIADERPDIVVKRALELFARP